jgi:hypothetical protein
MIALRAALAFLGISPLAAIFWGVVAISVFIFGWNFYGHAYNKGLQAERATWVERQRVLIAERNTLKDMVLERDKVIADKDALIEEKNLRLLDAIPTNPNLALPRDSARRLRNIK